MMESMSNDKLPIGIYVLFSCLDMQLTITWHACFYTPVTAAAAAVSYCTTCDSHDAPPVPTVHCVYVACFNSIPLTQSCLLLF